MANLPRLPQEGTFRILDPGAGSGILSAAIADRIRRESPSLQVSIVAVEDDEVLFQALQETLRDIEHRANATTELVPAEFLTWALDQAASFDLVIQNPPYAKLLSSGEQQKSLRQNGIIVPNIYAAFMALGLGLLSKGGQQVSITPRSWMNGTYYSAFRRQFTGTAGIAQYTLSKVVQRSFEIPAFYKKPSLSLRQREYSPNKSRSTHPRTTFPPQHTELSHTRML